MGLTRQGGKLVEVSEESMQQRLDRQTTSPAQAQAQGQTPKQQDMTGTPAQKKPILEQRVGKEDTLRGSERLREARQMQTEAESMAAEKAAQVSQLGTLGTRVQDLVTQQFETAAQQQVGQAQVKQPALATTLGLSPEELEIAKADPASNYSQISAALNEFMLSSDANAGESALVKLTQLGLSSEHAKSLIDTTANATGKVVAESMSDKVTLGQLDLTELGYESNEQLAELLGISVGDLNSMTIPQLEQSVQAQQQAQFNRVGALKAELSSLPPGSMQREILLRELRDLGGVGVTGMETKVAETVEELDTADEVMIAGQTFEVEELLRDEQIGDLIMDWIAADPDERESIFPSEEYPELTAWIEANQLALGELSTSLGENTTSFNEAQDEFSNIGQLEGLDIKLNEDILATFIPDYDPSQPVTTEQLQDIQATLAASAVGQIQQNTGEWDKESTDAFWHKLNDLSAEEKELIGTMGAGDIMTASQSADTLSEYQGMADFLGLDGSSKMMFDTMSQENIAEYKPVYEAISGTGKEMWLENEYFSGLSGEDMMTVINSENADEIFKDVQEYSTTRDAITSAENVEDVVDLLFDDPSADMDQITDQYAQAQKWADLGDEKAKAQVSWFKEHIDLNGDGKLDENDFQLLSEKISGLSQEVTKEDLLSGNGSFSTFMEKLHNGLGTTVGKTLGAGYRPTDKMYIANEKSIEDGAVTDEELNDMFLSSSEDKVIEFLNKLSEGGLEVADPVAYLENKVISSTQHDLEGKILDAPFNGNLNNALTDDFMDTNIWDADIATDQSYTALISLIQSGIHNLNPDVADPSTAVSNSAKLKWLKAKLPKIKAARKQAAKARKWKEDGEVNVKDFSSYQEFLDVFGRTKQFSPTVRTPEPISEADFKKAVSEGYVYRHRPGYEPALYKKVNSAKYGVLWSLVKWD